MRIVIDLQGAQTAGSRFRGIGRYTLALANAIVKHRGGHEVVMAANGALGESISSLREMFFSVLGRNGFRVWDAPTGVHGLDRSNPHHRAAAELVREAFLAELRPDVIVLSSLFEGAGDDSVASIRKLHSIPTSVILYDLIPLIKRDEYLSSNVDIEGWYEKQLSYLRQADLLLAISASSAQEAIDHLGFPADQVINIGTAADPQFRRGTSTAQNLDRVCSEYGLTRPFVMYTGGIDYRKNIEGLISAYARLPRALRRGHQLAIVCKADAMAQARLREFAERLDLRRSDLVLTGFVPESDLIALYHACRVFVFPSLHEGFGLPALEAMSCGAAVIASNTSSLPEVVGLNEALFDPNDPTAISTRLQQVLTDGDFRRRLVEHGLQQASRFSWDATAQRALAALEQLHAAHSAPAPTVVHGARRPTLAYVSPLPPEQSGISDYSAELLPELARHYDIELIVERPEVEPQWLSDMFPVRDSAALRAKPGRYDRILYHFGNSAFHRHMFGLLADVPGVVVLHDFYLSGVLNWLEHQGGGDGLFARQLYESHGYAAAQQRYSRSDPDSVIWDYPANRSVLEGALGVIVHSPNSIRLAQQWYGDGAGMDWGVIPLLRTPIFGSRRQQARRRQGLPADATVTCSFGLLGPTKLNLQLLRAWLASEQAKISSSYLVFVGDNHDSDYGRAVQDAIAASGCQERIRITGWADVASYRDHLAAADLAVQLRTRSRGEMSASVLDCMNYGVATIVNAHGATADLPNDAVCMLPDNFDLSDLSAAIDRLAADATYRKQVGERGQTHIRMQHGPRACAQRYAEVIEATYLRANGEAHGAIKYLAQCAESFSRETVLNAVQCISQNTTPTYPKQLLIDVSGLAKQDIGTGIQRIVRSIILECLLGNLGKVRIEPIYADINTGNFRYARHWTCSVLNMPATGFTDDLVEAHFGDTFLALDLNYLIASSHCAVLNRWQILGVEICVVVYDLLPLRLPSYFPPEANTLHTAWLRQVAKADRALCITKTVAADLEVWVRENGLTSPRNLTIDSFQLGSDLGRSRIADEQPTIRASLLANLLQRPSFLMVGTIEPRKGHAQVLAAFEKLWQAGVDLNLVIVGRQGWMVDALTQLIRNHTELNRRLHWLGNAGDDVLDYLYRSCTCLIVASHGEGVGLPIVEAASRGLPVIARDLDVFREVAGDHALYFRGDAAEELASAVHKWLDDPRVRPTMPKLRTWRESAEDLLRKILHASSIGINQQ